MKLTRRNFLQTALLVGAGSNSLKLSAISAQEYISVKDFGAAGNGIMDDTVAIQKAINSVGSSGGTVYLNGKHLIKNNLIVNANVTLKGQFSNVGSTGNNDKYDYTLLPALILSPGNSIYLKGGAGIVGALIYNKDLNFKAVNSDEGFTGTAIKILDSDDAFVFNSMILGFNQAIYANGSQRVRCDYINFDCINGISVNHCLDISYISNCHGWCFLTVTKDVNQAKRSGTAYKFTNIGDWNKVTNCFAYGYFRGLHITDCSSMVITGCGFDSPNDYKGQLGILIEGLSSDTLISNCQVAANDTGLYINTNDAMYTIINNCTVWDIINNAIWILKGNAIINGGIIRGNLNLKLGNKGVAVDNSVSRVSIDNMAFINVNIPIVALVPTSKIHIGNNNIYQNIGNNINSNMLNLENMQVANTINLPMGSKTIILFNAGINLVTLNKINGGYAGLEVNIIFKDKMIISQKGNINLSTDIYRPTAGSTLKLIYDGSQWLEISRSIN